MLASLWHLHLQDPDDKITKNRTRECQHTDGIACGIIQCKPLGNEKKKSIQGVLEKKGMRKFQFKDSASIKRR